MYNLRPHSETRTPPQTRWEAGAFIPRMPDSLEQLDLLLSTVAKPRKVHTDGIHFLALRFIDPVLADYVREDVTIRYDPRDITEIRVYLRTLDGEKFLCRAICPDLAEETVSLKTITAARNARRKHLRGQLTTRTAVVDALLAAHSEPLPAAYPAPALRTWTTPDESTAADPAATGHTSGPKPAPSSARPLSRTAPTLPQVTLRDSNATGMSELLPARTNTQAWSSPQTQTRTRPNRTQQTSPTLYPPDCQYPLAA
ncbi:Mu transposase C-terminal domain-containing protein [Nonomuraea sp. NPDC049269]|uniref:Mu transposase C-terminal domain-containing protein n=1 Tax=Nonomuraea sp. NPDC049269 TaxID=3364349 RepID=UPI0037217130